MFSCTIKVPLQTSEKHKDKKYALIRIDHVEGNGQRKWSWGLWGSRASEGVSTAR